jgi:hypothetical protein
MASQSLGQRCSRGPTKWRESALRVEKLAGLIGAWRHPGKSTGTACDEHGSPHNGSDVRARRGARRALVRRMSDRLPSP